MNNRGALEMLHPLRDKNEGPFWGEKGAANNVTTACPEAGK